MKKNTDASVRCADHRGCAPAIWGSTYFVTTSFLPHGYPLTVRLAARSAGRPAAAAIVRKLPHGHLVVSCLRSWRAELLVLLGDAVSCRPIGCRAAWPRPLAPFSRLIVIVLSRVFLGRPIRALAVGAGLVGMVGVALAGPDAECRAGSDWRGCRSRRRGLDGVGHGADAPMAFRRFRTLPLRRGN